nr:hypothetical protein CR01_90077 [Staphylococcus capitis CR01]
MITGVMAVSGKISNPMSKTQKMKYKRYVLCLIFLGETIIMRNAIIAPRM